MFQESEGLTPPPGGGTADFVEETETTTAAANKLTGTIRYHHHFASEYLHNERTLAVYLPPCYKQHAEERYPVLYMQDGQNLFDAATSAVGIPWQANDTTQRLILEKRIRPVIIVGIYNTPDRMHEYTWHYDATQKAGGKGDIYGRFLLEEVKPFIDAKYRTLSDRRHTAIAGSSLGGLISLSLARAYPRQIGLCAAMSPSLWWCKGQFLKEAEQSNLSWMRFTKFWLDFGTKEGAGKGHVPSGIVRARKLVQLFDQARLLPGKNYYYFEAAGGEHNEAHWAARMDKMLLFFYGRR
jgi:predicted alpha/beta superfamily hydrolase